MEDACIKFRSFFESSGVSEAITEALSKLFMLKVKPVDSVEFLRQNLPPPERETIKGLKSELAGLYKDIERLNKMALKAEKRKKKRKKPATNVEDGTESVITDYAETIVTESILTDITEESAMTEATRPNALSSIAEEDEL